MIGRRALFQRNALIFITFCSLLFAAGCEVIDKLRPIFQPQEEWDQSNGDNAKIAITVQPSDNIEVFLDGEPVATESPYVSASLKAEKHQLHIESKGYHSFSLIFELSEHKTLTLPIELRKKTVPPVTKGPKDNKKTALYDRAPPTGAGIRPAKLTLSTDPLRPLLWDGEEVSSKALTLNRLWGHLDAGPIGIKFRYNEVGILEVSIPTESPSPNETISWLRNSLPLKGGDVFRLPKGTTALVRLSSENGRQILLIERH